MSINGNEVDGYILQRSYQASARLNLQTYLWRDSLGYIVHPTIPPVQSDARVADVGTGTGLWLTQLNDGLPFGSVRLDGYDIDISQCPIPEWMPSNIHFRAWNVVEPVPEELVGQYDLVHLRLVMIGIATDDMDKVVHNLSRLLKPGGWLQWEEMNNYDNKIIKVNAALDVSAITELLEWMTAGPKKYREGKEWREMIPVVLEQHGFENIAVENHIDPPRLRRWLTEVSFQTLTEFANKVYDKDSKELKWLSHLLERAHDECKKGAAMHMGKLICVARKKVKRTVEMMDEINGEINGEII